MDVIQNLSPAKRALLQLRLQRDAARASGHAIPRRPSTAPAPLSFAQQRLWFLDQLYPGHPAYNVPRALRLRGKLDVAALEHALNSIIRRHETLRTTFRSEGEDPVQVVSREAQLRLRMVDVTDGTEAERESRALDLATEEVRRPFALGNDLMLRAALLRLTPEDHILVLVTHHIASDGWSRGILFRELAAFYTGLVTNQPASLPDCPVQYSDFAIWQREWMQGEVLQKQLAYWKRQLGGIPARLELPTDRVSPATPTFHGAKQFPSYSRALLDALRAISRQEGVTLFMTLLAAFQILLHRYTGADDLVVGTPIAGRNFKELEGLIGDFVNVLMLRADLSGNPTFRELLACVRKTALEAYENQDLPFEKLIEELEHGRIRSQNALYQAAFALESSPAPLPQFPGLAVTSLAIDSGTAKADLSLTLAEDETGLKGKLEYNTDIFLPETVGRLAGHFGELLQGIASNPDQRISDLPLLTATERRQVLVDWNATASPYSNDRYVHELFVEHVKRAPEALAVAGNGQAWSYHELNCRANRLAHYLQKRGVGPETVVAICAERSPELVLGMLAVWKAGGAYAPIDPAYPADRIAFILRDSGASVLLSQRHLKAGLPADAAEVIFLDALDALSNESCADPPCQLRPEHLAYVIYTSGSTGKPKGVEITHDSLLNLMAWLTQYFDVTSADRFSQISAPAFDASVMEIWTPFSTGASLHIPDQETRAMPAKLLAWFAAEAISIAWVPTPLAEAILEEPFPPTLALRHFYTGGDRLQRCPDRNLPFRFYNAYGPTENTVTSTTFEVTGAEEREAPPIGRPLGNMQAYVLDRYRNPVPVGVPGELYLAGAGLARGYRNRPDLTAEKFVFHTLEGSKTRLYRTGDLVRYRPDGNLQFLGRLDHQVKIRGFRIELEEIEVVLGQHEQVQQAAVLVREDQGGPKRLVAYLVPVSPPPSLRELRTYLKERLPDYMVPSAFVVLDKFPLTPNGKLDRKALPAPEPALCDSERQFVAPSTPIEEALASIWCELLRVPKVSMRDNFFELGGHSLMATRVISRIRDRFQVELPLRALFESPTIGELADTVIERYAEAMETGEMARAESAADGNIG